MAALQYLRPRNHGSIVCVGSAVAYRSVTLQSVYCGAKFEIRGFLDALRFASLHDKLDITLIEINLPAVNTSQFDWARRMKRHAAFANGELTAVSGSADAISADCRHR